MKWQKVLVVDFRVLGVPHAICDDPTADITAWGTAGWGVDPAALGTHRQAELIHASGCMLSTLDCIALEFLAQYVGGNSPPQESAMGFKAGATIFIEDNVNYVGGTRKV